MDWRIRRKLTRRRTELALKADVAHLYDPDRRARKPREAGSEYPKQKRMALVPAKPAPRKV